MSTELFYKIWNTKKIIERMGSSSGYYKRLQVTSRASITLFITNTTTTIRAECHANFGPELPWASIFEIKNHCLESVEAKARDSFTDWLNGLRDIVKEA